MSRLLTLKKTSVLLSYGVLSLTVLALAFALTTHLSWWLIGLLSLSTLMLVVLIRTQQQLHSIAEKNAITLQTINQEIDEQTGLPDFRAFEKRMENECRRCVREFSPLTLMYVGFDNASLTDDDIKRVGEKLQHVVCRPGDLVARLDTTTFAFILPSTNELVKQLAERALTTLSDMKLPSRAAIGLCTFQPNSQLNAVNAMLKVNSRLAEAKAQGGNCISAETEEHTDPSVTYTH